VDATSYALYHGVRRTRSTLRAWQRRPLPVLGAWVAGSTLAALGLLSAVLVVSALSSGYVQPIELRPPFAVGDAGDIAMVLSHNLLVLALHAMACVAGFIAGSSLPLQAESKSGISRWVHEHGGRIAIAFVVCATTFSLSALLLLGLLPHALPELVALFLPLAAWIVASRRGQWDQLLAATVVTVAIALPVLVAAAFVEVYVSPHLFTALTGLHPPIVGTWDGFTVRVR
jgi:hypothetical protein